MTARLRVSEAAQLAGVSPSTLRAWESSGLITPSRTGRYRWFSQRDIRDLQEIASLRARGFNVAAIRSMLRGDRAAPSRGRRPSSRRRRRPADAPGADPAGSGGPGSGAPGSGSTGSAELGSGSAGSAVPGSGPAGEPRPGPAVEPRSKLAGEPRPGPAVEPHPAPPEQPLGEKLRAARHRRGLSLREASGLAGLSVSHLSAIECGTRNASLAGLQRLAVALGIGVSDLFGDEQRPPRRLVRAGQRPVLDTGDRRVRVESLSVGAALLEPHIYLVEPGGGSQGSYHHDGEETVYVLAGEVEFWLNEVERHTVRAGDCLTFPSSLAHRWQNHGPGRLAMLWVNTPITF